MSLQKQFSICLSEAYQTRHNLIPLNLKKLHSSTPKIHILINYAVPKCLVCVGDEFSFLLAKPSRIPKFD